MNTALISSPASQIYAKIENPLAFIDQMGKSFHQSQIMGVATPGDGAVLALTCMCEGITPLEFAKTYHIINGRPSMRADMMAAKFRGAGGKCKWVNLGDDGLAAEAVFAFDGQELSIKYTIEDARNVVGDKLDKPDSNWRKDRGAMLRARLITKAIRILAPELIAGVYTPEELEDSGVTVTTADKPAKKSQADRRKELEADTSAAVVVTSEQEPYLAPMVAETIVDAVIEPTPKEATTIDDSDQPATPEMLQEIVKIGGKMPSQAEPGKGMGIKEIADGICKACKVDKPQQATRKQIRTLIERWRAALGG